MKNFPKIKKEIERSILLTSAEKKSYLDELKDLPDPMLAGILKRLQKDNGTIDEYINTALVNDPKGKLLTNLKQKIAKAKRNLLGKQEQSEAVDAEAYLIQNLQ